MALNNGFSSFVAFFAFGSTGLISAVLTFVALWILARPKLSFATGVAAGLVFVKYFWLSGVMQDEDFQPIHRLLEIAVFAGAILPPWWVVQRMTGWTVEQYPNEKWSPPWKRGKTGDQDEKPRRAGASNREQTYERKPTGGADPRWNRYFRRASALPLDEAWQILGLESGASPDEIRDAHHRLTTRLETDEWGSRYLAGMVNEARDVLLDG